MADNPHAPRSGQWLLDRLPPNIRTQLSPEACAAITEAAARDGSPHSVDIRLSLPLPFRRVYLAVLAGSERRSPERIDAQRRRQRLIRAANILFLMAIAVLFYAAYQLAALLIGAVML